MSARVAHGRCGVLLAALFLPWVVGCNAAERQPDREADAGELDASTDAATIDADEPTAVIDAGPPCVIPDQGLPTDVFCTGLYVDRNPERIDALALPYTPGVTLWSDGAEKSRYLQLPQGATIDSSDMDAWKFPVGTKVWKEFRVGGMLVETRLFWKRVASEWASGTYIWNEAHTEAVLNTSRTPILLASGYEIPINKDCGKCHHGGADSLLGVEAIALGLPTAQGLTLARLVEGGALSVPPAQTTVSLPEDATGKAGAALGFLHANCGMPCHSSRGLGDETQLLLRLRADELFTTGGAPADARSMEAFRASLGVKPSTASVAQQFPGALRISAGDHEKSLLWLLSHRRDKYAMPPLVSHAIDEESTAQLAAWIDAL